MSAVTVCPKCSRIVSLPPNEDRSVWVHCPLCHSQYQLQLALDYVPPALAVIPAPQNDSLSDTIHDPLASGATALGADVFHPGEPHAAEQAPNEQLGFGQPELGHGGIDLGSADLAAGAPMTYGDSAHGVADPSFAEHTFNDSLGMPQETHDHSGHSSAEAEFADPEFATEDDEFGIVSHEHSEIAKTESGNAEHESAMFGDPSLEVAEHGISEHSMSEHGAEGLMEPGGAEHGDLAEHEDLDGGEFRFSDEMSPGEGEAGEHADQEPGVEGHHLGAIATMVQAAPPQRKKRKPRMLVRVIGICIGISFSLLGLIIVYSVFLFFKVDQFGIGKYWPEFIDRGRHSATTNAVATPTKTNKPTVADAPPPNPGAALPNPNGFVPPTGAASSTGPADKASSNATGPAAQPKPSDIAKTDVPAATTKGPADSGDLTRTEDPLNTAADVPGKTDLTKIDPLGPTLPKLDLPTAPPKLPGDNPAPKTPDKSPDTTTTKSPDVPTEIPTVKPIDKPAVSPLDVPPKSPTEKPVENPTDKPINPPVKTPSDNLPSDKPPEKTPAVNPLDKPTDKPPVNPTDKPADKPIEPPKVEPVKPDSIVGLKSPTPVKAADIDSAAQEVRTARDAYLAAAATKDPVAEKRPRILYYRAMSHLATVLAGRLDETAPTATADRGKMDALADELLAGQSATTAAAERDDFSMLSSKWIASPSRKEAGVFLIGKLVKTQPAGRVFISQLKLPGADSEISVATAVDPTAGGAVKAGEGVIVLGALVDDPAQHLNGYEGNATQVVWAVKIDPAPAASAPPAGGKSDDSVGAKSAPEKNPK